MASTYTYTCENGDILVYDSETRQQVEFIDGDRKEVVDDFRRETQLR